MDINTIEFNGLIKKIRTKRTVCVVLTVVFILGILLSMPIQLEIMGEHIIDTDGSYALIILFAIAAFASLFAYVLFSVPIHNALFLECDARKHLILLTSLEKEKNVYPMLATAYFYIGDFDTAIYYDKKAFEKKNANAKISALYRKARSEFFGGRIEDFKKTASDFQAMTNSVKLNEKQQKSILKCNTVINLFLAIVYEDGEKIKEFASQLDIVDDTRISTAFDSYLKGLAAYTINDKVESTHRFMSVCDIAPKTVLGVLAKEFLGKLNSENNTDGEI